MLPNELARVNSVTGSLEFRPDTLRLRCAFPSASSSDGHDIAMTFECGARVPDSRSDRALFHEVMLRGRSAVTQNEVSDFLTGATRDVMHGFASGRGAAALVSTEARQQAIDTFRAAASAAAFSAGIELLPPFTVEISSASLQRHKLEQMQRQRAEERAAGQVEHLRRAGELLKQFQSIRASAGSIEPGDVLQQISPADRGSTLEALMLASSQEAQRSTLLAVSGATLVKIELANESATPTLIALPETLGPLRSVQRASRAGESSRLLIGARDGVMLIDPSNPNGARVFRAPTAERESALGFNGGILDDSTNTIVATHAQHGAVRWHLEASSSEPASVSSADHVPTARFPVSLSAGVVAVASDRDVMLTRDGVTSRLPIESSSPIVALLVDANRLFVVRQSGRIDVIDRTTLEVSDHQQRAGNIVHACALPWLGSVRLLLAREDGPIECVGPDDQLVTQYSSTQRGCKMISASADVVAAVSGDRQRVILWHAWDGRRPFAEVHLTSQTRHRVADIEFT